MLKAGIHNMTFAPICSLNKSRVDAEKQSELTENHIVYDKICSDLKSLLVLNCIKSI